MTRSVGLSPSTVRIPEGRFLRFALGLSVGGDAAAGAHESGVAPTPGRRFAVDNVNRYFRRAKAEG
ncbi:hypothetical protein KCP73_21465 [Salmonella enterica subsp. enterica]|nr:hypothetical protein KCP73_21465 [Salmonella enterica subsp. enterica]